MITKSSREEACDWIYHGRIWCHNFIKRLRIFGTQNIVDTQGQPNVAR